MIQNLALLQVDIHKWEKIPQPAPAVYPYIMSVNAQGFLSIGDRLCQKMRETAQELRFEFYLSADGRMFGLEPNADGSYIFPEGGRIKDCELGKKLVNYGISLPARCHVAWNSGAGAWVGCLVSEIEAGRVQALRKSLAASKGKRGGGN